METTLKQKKTKSWTAWIMSGMVILFMLMDGLGKLFKPAPVIEGTLELGFSGHHISIIGILALFCVILYAIPRTAVLGAVFLTAFYGGVVATHVRLDNPLFSHVLFPVYLAVLAWGGLWLRNADLRKVFPILKVRTE